MDRAAAGAGHPAHKNMKPTSRERGLHSSTESQLTGSNQMDMSNPNAQSTEVNPILSYKDAPNTESDDVLQLALSIVCMLYGKHMISFCLHSEGFSQLEYAVKETYDLLKANKVSCCEYPGL